MTCRHVLDDDCTPVGLVFRHSRIQQFLDLMLQVSVECKLHIAAVLRLNSGLLTARHHGTVRRDLEGLCARGTRQQCVELRLHARRPLSLGVDRPNDGRSDIAIGVLTFEDRLPLDPVNIELANLTVGHGIHVALDVHVGGIAQHHAAELRLIHAEDGGQKARGLRGPTADLVTIIITVDERADIHLVHRDVVRLDGVRQDDTRGIGNRATRSGDLRRRGTHALPLGRQ